MDMQKPFLPWILCALLTAPVWAVGQKLPVPPRGVKTVTQVPSVSASRITSRVKQARIVRPLPWQEPLLLSPVLRSSDAKKLLNTHTRYTQGAAKAQQILQNLKSHNIPTLPEEEQEQLLTQLSSFVADPALSGFLRQNIQAGNYAAVRQDLADYYNLTLDFIPAFELRANPASTHRNIFVYTTLDYLKRHPHKATVGLREILRNPNVSSQDKTFINDLLRKPPQLLAEQESAFTQTLHDIYNQHILSLANAYAAAEVQITVAYYQTLLQELTRFTEAHQRAPRWDGPMDERTLYNRLAVIVKDNPFNLFEEAAQPLQAIRTLLEAYPAATLSWPETLQQLETFIQQHGFYPRSFSGSNGQTTEEELKLLDNVGYYLGKHPALSNDIRQLKEKYGLP